MTDESNSKNDNAESNGNESNILIDENTDQFEVSFRILGNEIFGMQISSRSKAKNWAFFGIFTLFALAILFDILTPTILTALEFLN